MGQHRVNPKKCAGHAKQGYVQRYRHQDQQYSQSGGHDVTEARVDGAAHGDTGFQLPGEVGILDEELPLELLQNPALAF
ncbi:hypothetical protein ASF74_20240 [Arthrobacter sp. Leaf145]|nr:hypothetical protein ASF74_20240 [Arthrobacter sp. Leaf145]